MEGPSLFLAAEQLVPMIGYKIMEVVGNTKIGKERLLDKNILSIFSFGKYLFLQFDSFALRIHFLLWGSFQAIINGKKVTGDYPLKTRMPRLALVLKDSWVAFYSCSIRFVESANAKEECNFSIDIMSKQWKSTQAFSKLKKIPNTEIGDALLDQTIFAGVGNIIKNEVLVRAKTSPQHLIGDLSDYKLKKIIRITNKYVFEFYGWRKNFELKKHYIIYRQRTCKLCGSKVLRKRTGLRNRWSYICPACEISKQKKVTRQRRSKGCGC